MDIQYRVRTGEVLPWIESMWVTRQTEPCPPGVLEVLHHKIIADVARDATLREITFTPFGACTIRAALEVVPESPAPGSHR